MDNKQKKSVEVAMICLILIFSLLTYLASTTWNTQSFRYKIPVGWKADVNGTIYENVDLNTFTFKQQNRKEVVTLTMELPDATVKNPMLVFHVSDSAIQVELDGELHYQYGMNEIEKNLLVGYGYHFIELPDDYIGKVLTVRVIANENDAYSNFRIPYITNGINAIRDIFMEKKIILGINIFLLMFGMIVFLVSLFFSYKQRKFTKLTFSALFSITISTWSLCNYDLILLYTYTMYIKVYMEFIALYMCPIFVYGYFWSDIMSRKEKLIKKIYLVIMGIQTIFLVSSLILHYTNICHFPAMLWVQHLIIASMIVSYLALTIYDIRKKTFESSALTLGMLALVVICAIDLVRYNILRHGMNMLRDSFPSVLYMGGFIFVLAQMVDFLTGISTKMYEGAKAEALEKLAYTDSLTGLSNRRKCDELFDELDMSSEVYGILTFDLNNLKLTNDTLGHEIGDILIKKFSEVLRVVFGEVGTVCRMGGDEFIVIFADVQTVDIRALVEKMENLIDKINADDENLHLSTAYGYCRSNEPRCKDVKSVYKKADSRMYRQKSAMKKYGN